jgi:DNA-directed RNA polymerase subunit RPC12/RpoP
MIQWVLIMKCIACSTDNTLKDRTGNYGRCKQCGHHFVFEPTSMGTVKVTDSMFQKAIDDLSRNDVLFFTPKQLAYFLDQRIKRKARLPTIGCVTPYIFLMFIAISVGTGLGNSSGTLFMVFVPGIGVTLLFMMLGLLFSRAYTSDAVTRKNCAKGLQFIGALALIWGVILAYVTGYLPGFFATALVGLLAIALGSRQIARSGGGQKPLFEQSQVQEWLTRWQSINAPITKMSDVSAYSFDRLVVCDSATVAQMLIANNFHFENNCAILSVTGYPQSIFNTAMEMVQRNPELKVYALHDCSPRGLELPHHLRSSPQWFQNGGSKIIDIGLLPVQVMASQGMFVQTSTDMATAAKQMVAEVRRAFSQKEMDWLEAGNCVELESFTPQRLIQVLQMGINGSQMIDSGDSGFLMVGDSGYYTTDSFG